MIPDAEITTLTCPNLWNDRVAVGVRSATGTRMCYFGVGTISLAEDILQSLIAAASKSATLHRNWCQYQVFGRETQQRQAKSFSSDQRVKDDNREMEHGQVCLQHDTVISTA